MRVRLLSFLILCLPAIIIGQDTPAGPQSFSLQRVSGKTNFIKDLKMACDPTTTDLVVTSCDGEEPGNGNNNPSDGAFMTWTADGSQNQYYSQIYNGADTFRIVMTGTNNSVYDSLGDGSYTADLVIGNGTTGCLQPGLWTVRVWDVMDLNNDNQPDVDGDGNIIGCFAECTYNFEPTCPNATSPAFQSTVTEVSCAGNDGAISLRNINTNRFYCTTTAGVGLDFSWTGPDGFTANTRDIANLVAGDYTVTLSDIYSCDNVVTITVSTLPDFTMSCAPASAPTSPFSNNGRATIDIGGGVGPFDLTYTGPLNGSRNNLSAGMNTLTGLAPGRYTITVTDRSTGCTQTCMVTIAEAPCIVMFTVVPVIDATGVVSVTIDPTAGSADFQLTYTGPTNSTGPITGIGNAGTTLPGSGFTFGTYTFVLAESFRPGCRDTVVITFEGPDCADIIVTDLQQIDPSCSGESDGTLEIDVDGGENPVLTWTGPGVTGSNSPLLENLAQGTYEYEVTDDRGCEVPGSYTLTEPGPLLLTCTPVNETANANDDGKIGIGVSGGIPPYTLSYTATDQGGNPLPGETDLAISNGDTLRNLPSGTYNITIEDVNGCSQTCSSLITQPDCSLDIGCTPTNPTMFGGTGSITVTYDVSDTYVFDIFQDPDPVAVGGGLVSNSTVGMADGLAPGNYRIETSSFGGCTGECRFTIEEAPCDLDVTGLSTDPTCGGSDDGSIQLTITGASTGLTIDWNQDTYDGETSVSDLPGGTYTIRISDDVGCPVPPLVIELTDPAPVSVTLEELSPIRCAGDATGRLRATPAGAVGAVSYVWSDPSFPDGPVVNNVPAGVYTVEITDENGCGGPSTRTSLTVLERAAISLSCGAVAETVLGGNNGKLGFTLSGGTAPYTFELNGMSQPRPPLDTFDMLPPGEYTITVTDDNNCSSTCRATVNPGGCGAFDVVIMSSQPDCDDAFGTLTASATAANGMVTYAWSNGATSPVITDLGPGEYCVTATDARDCESIECATVLEFTDFPTVTIGDFSLVCGEDCTTISGTFTGTPPFRLDYEVIRAGTLVQGDVMSSSVVLSREFCPGDFGVTDFSSTDIRFTMVTDANGCMRPLDDVRAVPHAFPGLNTISETLCAGDTLFVADQTFQADRVSGTITLPNGSSGGCDSIIEVDISFFPNITGTFDTIICEGTSVTVGDLLLSEAVTDSLFRIPNPVSGCDSLVLVTVEVIPARRVILEGDGLVCSDSLLTVNLTYDGDGVADVRLSSNPGESITLLSGTAPFVSKVAPGTTVTILSATEMDECPIITSGSVSVTASDLSVSISDETDPGRECGDNDSGVLAAVVTGGSGPVAYSWSNGMEEDTLSGVAPGTYSVTVTDGRGCEAEAEITLSGSSTFDLATTVAPPICVGDPATIVISDAPGGVGPFLYRIDTGSFTLVDSFPAIIQVEPGTVLLEVEDALGCRTLDTFEFDTIVPPILRLTPDQAILPFGDSVLVEVLTDLEADSFRVAPGPDTLIPGSRIWLFADGSLNYTFSVVDALGCSASAEFRLVSDARAPVYAPNAFSPNQDGNNDLYRLYSSRQVIRVDNFMIFNRWGTNVYELQGPVDPQDQTWGWTGSSPSGTLHQAGVYGFTASLLLLNGETKTVKGEVLLVR